MTGEALHTRKHTVRDKTLVVWYKQPLLLLKPLTLMSHGALHLTPQPIRREGSNSAQYPIQHNQTFGTLSTGFRIYWRVPLLSSPV